MVVRSKVDAARMSSEEVTRKMAQLRASGESPFAIDEDFLRREVRRCVAWRAAAQGVGRRRRRPGEPPEPPARPAASVPLTVARAVVSGPGARPDAGHLQHLLRR